MIGFSFARIAYGWHQRNFKPLYHMNRPKCYHLYEELIAAYEVDVRFPDVSGMEHLEMLLTRSEIAKGEAHLTAEQRLRLAEADKVLLQQAKAFSQAINKIADLEAWRLDENVPVTHWWWYLDVLAHIPELRVITNISDTTFASA
jgi:hypothetical protein